MAADLRPLPVLHPIAGITIGTTNAAIKQTQRDDLVLFALPEGCNSAAVFTRNAFRAAPVVLAEKHLDITAPRYLLINAGNANAGTGEQGIQDALTCCKAVSDLTGCATEAVLPFSTGVIGQRLPTERISKALPAALSNCRDNGWVAAANAIMTTDTAPKGASLTCRLDEKVITFTGIAKGAGMIRPDMATMLAFVATDLAIPKNLLTMMVRQAVDASFNCITVDGDTSTNDACLLVATGQSKVQLNAADSAGCAIVQQALDDVFTRLAQAIVRDGEGATKFITIEIEEGLNKQECRAVADTIAHSSLVKTAFFASDANWGRILAAVGRAGLVSLDLKRIQIYLDDVCIVHDGCVAADYTEADGTRVMAKTDITIRVLLGRGSSSTHLWTCDLSTEYVNINANYRT